MHVHFWNKGVLTFTDVWGPGLTHFIIPGPPGQFLFEWQYVGTWSNRWILMRLCLFVQKDCFCGCVLVLFFFVDYKGLKLLTTVTQHHSRVHDSTEKSTVNFIACIDKYVSSTLSTPLTHDIQCMQSCWEKNLQKAMQGFKKKHELYFNYWFNYSNT